MKALQRLSAACLAVILASCATFDKTNITSDVRVPGPALSFVVPTETPWSAVDFGTGSQIRLSQLNFDDSYIIRAAVNRGPYTGMYKDSEQHLSEYQTYLSSRKTKEGFVETKHFERSAPEYGAACIEYREQGEDWAGRNSEGPAYVEKVGIICPHEGLSNILVNLEISRRYEAYAKPVDLNVLSKRLFNSLEFDSYN